MQEQIDKLSRQIKALVYSDKLRAEDGIALITTLQTIQRLYHSLLAEAVGEVNAALEGKSKEDRRDILNDDPVRFDSPHCSAHRERTGPPPFRVLAIGHLRNGIELYGPLEDSAVVAEELRIITGGYSMPHCIMNVEPLPPKKS